MYLAGETRWRNVEVQPPKLVAVKVAVMVEVGVTVEAWVEVAVEVNPPKFVAVGEGVAVSV